MVDLNIRGKKIRTFNGKRFRLAGRSPSKRNAEKRAQGFRENGYYVRVVPEKLYGKPAYGVYVRVWAYKKQAKKWKR